MKPVSSIMQNHFFRPIPALDNLPQPANKEERLRVIIANLEKHHQDVSYDRASYWWVIRKDRPDFYVRSSMLAEARQKLEAARSATPSGIDIDGEEHTDQTQFIVSMSAPYVEGPGDPCTPPGSTVQPANNVRQAMVAIEISIAQEVIEKIEAYDKHAKQTREY